MAKVLIITIFFTALILPRAQSCFIPRLNVLVPQKTIPAGYHVTKVEAGDCDPKSLRLTSNDPCFTVQNGVIVALSPVSVETGERTFSVRVQDNNGPESETQVHLVYEQRQMANENSPVILKRFKRRWSPPPFNIMENEKGVPRPIDSLVSDSNINHSVYYTLSGPGVNLFPFGVFSIDEETGELHVHKAVDREEYPVFKLTANVYDIYTRKPTDLSLDITINVDDVNDNAPQFTGPLEFTVAEQRLGTFVGLLSSTDRDDPNTEHARVSYKLLSGSEYFAINSTTGSISTVTNTLDRETKDKHFAIVEVRDLYGKPNGLFSTATVTINLSDINDNPPTFTKTSFKATIAENEGEKLLLRIPVEDKDLINTPNWLSKFIITKGNENGNFRIVTDPKTNEGLLYVAKPLDYEQNSFVNLEVLARNEAELNGTSAQWQAVPVNVTVTDVDEGPQFSAPTVRFVVMENTPNGTVIGTYSALDPETKKSDGISYYKLYDPGMWVNVDRQTGQLKVANTIDRESDLVKDGMYNITVRAVDATSKTGKGTVILVIEDVNDNMPVTPSQLVLCQNTDDELGSVLVVAEDKDLSPYSDPFSFSLPPDNDGMWSVEPLNGTTATLKQVKSLPRGLYEVPLIVRDLQGFGAVQTVQVTICKCLTGACVAKRSSVALGPKGSLALFLPLLLLLLLCLLLLMFSLTKIEKKHILETEESKGTLLQSNTEALGDEVDSLVMAGNTMGFDQGVKGSMKGSMGNIGWQGNKSFSTMGGHSMHDFAYNQSGMTMTKMQDFTSGQYERYGAQQVGSHLLGNGMDYTNFTQDSLLRHWQTTNLVLQQRINYLGTKEEMGDDEEDNKDHLHCYGYEGAGSEAGSVGCCSNNDDSDNLDFLNTLGPKFKTLAEVCTKS